MEWNVSSVEAALQEIGEVRGGLQLYLKELLDSYHNHCNPERYYDILAGDWLEYFSHIVYSAFAEVVSGNKGVAGVEPVISVTSDIHEFDLLRLRSEFYDQLLYNVSVLLSGHSPAAWKFSSDSVAINHERGSLQTRAKQWLASGMSSKLNDVLLVNPHFKGNQWEMLSAARQWRGMVTFSSLQFPIHLPAPVDARWRMQSACAFVPVTGYFDVLRVLLPLYLPVSLLEGYKACRKEILSLPLSRPKVIYSANALHAHLVFKFLAAEWVGQGSRLLYHQHGGGYGVDRIHTPEMYEVRASDRFYTWGWESEGEPKVRPLSPAPLPSPLRKRTYTLLNCVNFPKVVFRMHFHPMPGAIETMQQETLDFLSALVSREDVLVRPYPDDYGWGFDTKMRRVAADAAFDDGRTGIFERFAQSRLVVHNYLGTSYLETLALNVPTVCFYDDAAYRFRPDAQPYMDELERVGILHRSGRDAAGFVNGLGGDPEEWWNEAEVQQARNEFVRRYANFSSDWKDQWEREFQLALNEAA